MLRHTKDIRGYKLKAKDEDFGKVKEFYFDDVLWTIRYLVADTGRWLPGRQVLLSPQSIANIDEDEKVIEIELTKKQIEESPPIEEDRPVSRQSEQKMITYYGWPVYWETVEELDEDSHLRSSKEVTGYKISSLNDDIGSIKNLVFDDTDWKLRYMVLDTKRFMPGKEVLLALDWIIKIDEKSNTIIVDVTSDTIKSAPEYNPESPIDRTFETAIYDHYKKKYYWV